MDNVVELGLSLLSSSICERLPFVVDLQNTHLEAEKVTAVFSWVKKIWKFFMTFVLKRGWGRGPECHWDFPILLLFKKQ